MLIHIEISNQFDLSDCVFEDDDSDYSDAQPNTKIRQPTITSPTPKTNIKNTTKSNTPSTKKEDATYKSKPITIDNRL